MTPRVDCRLNWEGDGKLRGEGLKCWTRVCGAATQIFVKPKQLFLKKNAINCVE
jgi:hypothetical protein